MKIKPLIFKGVLSIYSILPFQQLICEILRQFSVFRHRYFQDFRFKGVFTIALPQRFGSQAIQLYHHYHTSIENRLFWQGWEGWEPQTIQVWMQYASNAQTIMDIGANTGIYALTAASVNPNSRVFAFEPSKSTYQKLEKNILLNRLNIQAYPIALSNESGSATFYDYAAEHQYSASLHQQMSLDRPDLQLNAYEVSVKRLDTFIEEQGLSSIDLIKLDVEMFEPEVLEGMGNYLAKFRPIFLIEILNNEVGAKVEQYFEPLDYQYFQIHEEKGLVIVPQISHHKDHNYLLLPK